MVNGSHFIQPCVTYLYSQIMTLFGTRMTGKTTEDLEGIMWPKRCFSLKTAYKAASFLRSKEYNEQPFSALHSGFKVIEKWFNFEILKGSLSFF